MAVGQSSSGTANAQHDRHADADADADDREDESVHAGERRLRFCWVVSGGSPAGWVNGGRDPPGSRPQESRASPISSSDFASAFWSLS
jgi:hypothetical protein